jgi:hypothetical protein
MYKGEIWSSKPSQVLNVGVFFSTILFITIPVAYFRWRYLKGIRYSIKDGHLIIEKKFVGFEKNSFNLNDVEGITIYQPIFYKVFSLNNLSITLKNGQSIVLAGVKNAGDFTKAFNSVSANEQKLAY